MSNIVNTTNPNQPYVPPLDPKDAARLLFRRFNNIAPADAKALAQEIELGQIPAEKGLQRSVTILVPPTGEVAICIETKERRVMGGWHSLPPEFHSAGSLRDILSLVDRKNYSGVFKQAATNASAGGNNLLSRKLVEVALALDK